MSEPSPIILISCLLDVSGLMQEALEAGPLNEYATEHLRTVLQAALKFAQVEQGHDPNTLVFVGIFGLKKNVVGGRGDGVCPTVVDLFAVADALLGNSGDCPSGHDLIIERANKQNMSRITKYIRKELTDNETPIVDSHLERHPNEVQHFVDAILSEETINKTRKLGQKGGALAGAILGWSAFGFGGILISGICGVYAGNKAAGKAEDMAVEDSEALRLARHICSKWLQSFTEFVPRPIHDVIRILQRLQKRPDTTQQNQEGEKTETRELETLKRYIYGGTPMREALSRSLRVFRDQQHPQHRVLLLVSDGYSTDGDPLPIARELHQEKVIISTAYLTSHRTVHYRELYYQPAVDWNDGQRALFSMASRVSGVRHCNETHKYF